MRVCVCFVVDFHASVVRVHVLNIEQTLLTYTAPELYGRLRDNSELSVRPNFLFCPLQNNIYYYNHDLLTQLTVVFLRRNRNL